MTTLQSLSTRVVSDVNGCHDASVLSENLKYMGGRERLLGLSDELWRELDHAVTGCSSHAQDTGTELADLAGKL